MPFGIRFDFFNFHAIHTCILCLSSTVSNYIILILIHLSHQPKNIKLWSFHFNSIHFSHFYVTLYHTRPHLFFLLLSLSSSFVIFVSADKHFKFELMFHGNEIGMHISCWNICRLNCSSIFVLNILTWHLFSVRVFSLSLTYSLAHRHTHKHHTFCLCPATNNFSRNFKWTRPTNSPSSI